MPLPMPFVLRDLVQSFAHRDRIGEDSIARAQVWELIGFRKLNQKLHRQTDYGRNLSHWTKSTEHVGSIDRQRGRFKTIPFLSFLPAAAAPAFFPSSGR